MRAALGLWMLPLLAACGGPGGTSVNQVAANAAAPDAQQARLDSLPEGSRNGVFIRAIRDANQPCQQVVRSTRSGEQDGASTWSAECDGGARYTIVVGRNGDASVTPAGMGNGR